jgi:hypothetical protein
LLRRWTRSGEGTERQGDDYTVVVVAAATCD